MVAATQVKDIFPFMITGQEKVTHNPPVKHICEGQKFTAGRDWS